MNLALLACPVTWIIAAVIGLIAVIGYVCYKVQGWGTLWDGTVGFMKHSFLGFVESVKLYFSTMINGLMIGLDKIKLGWYKFKEAVGLGDSAENQAAIARINADIENRQQAIIEGAKRVADHAAKARASLDGIRLRWDSERSLGDVAAKLKTSLGIASPSCLAWEASWQRIPRAEATEPPAVRPGRSRFGHRHGRQTIHDDQHFTRGAGR